MGTSLSTEFDWVYHPEENRWRLGLPPSIIQQQQAIANMMNSSTATGEAEDDDDDVVDEDIHKNQKQQQKETDSKMGTHTSSSGSFDQTTKAPFILQHSQRNERALSMLYFSLVQAFCSAAGTGFNEDRSSATTVMKRRFDRPLVFTTEPGTIPMQDVEGGLGAVEPKSAAQTFLVARNFAPAFAELEGEDDEAAAQQANTGRTSRMRMSLEQTRERAAARRAALMNVQNASTTVNTSKDTTKFSPFHHYLEVSDTAGRCCFARLVDGGAVVFDLLPEDQIKMLNRDLNDGAEKAEEFLNSNKKNKSEKEEQENDEERDNEENEEDATPKEKKKKTIIIKKTRKFKRENEIGDEEEITEEYEEVLEVDEEDEKNSDDDDENDDIRMKQAQEDKNEDQPTVASDTITQPFDNFGLSIIKESVIMSIQVEKERQKAEEEAALIVKREAEAELRRQAEIAIAARKDKQREAAQKANELEAQKDAADVEDGEDKSLLTTENGKKKAVAVHFAEEKPDEPNEEQKEFAEKSKLYGGSQSFFGFDQIVASKDNNNINDVDNEDTDKKNNSNAENKPAESSAKQDDDDNDGGENISIFVSATDNSNSSSNSKKTTNSNQKAVSSDKSNQSSSANNDDENNFGGFSSSSRKISNLAQVTCHSLHHLMVYLSLVASVAVAEEVEYTMNYTTVEKSSSAGRRRSSSTSPLNHQNQQQRQRSSSSAKRSSPNNSNQQASATLASSSARNPSIADQQQQQQQKTVGEAIQSALWEFAANSPGFIRPMEPMHGHGRANNSPYNQRSRFNNTNNNRQNSPTNRRPGSPGTGQQQGRQQFNNNNNANKTLTFSRQPVFALRSLISRCGQTLFPPRGTAEARKLAATEENDLFFTASGSQMAVEVCSRILAQQHCFQPFLSVSFERAIEGDLTVSRLVAPMLSSSSSKNNNNSNQSKDNNNTMMTSNSADLYQNASANGSMSTFLDQHHPTTTTTSTSSNFSLLSKIKGLSPRIALSSSEAAVKAIMNGRLVSAVAESEIPGALLVASGSSVDVCHTSPKTLLAVTRELKSILEQIVRDCPADAHPGEFLARFLLDSCFFNHAELIEHLIGGFNTPKERSILGSKHQAGSVFKLLFGLTEIVPLPEGSADSHAVQQQNALMMMRNNNNNTSDQSNAQQTKNVEQKSNKDKESEGHHERSKDKDGEDEEAGGSSEKTLEEQLYSALHHSPCSRTRILPGRSHQYESEEQRQRAIQQLIDGSNPNQNQNTVITWKNDEMQKNSPADYVNSALKTVVDRTTATSNEILSKIKEVSHVLNNTKRNQNQNGPKSFFSNNNNNNNQSNKRRRLGNNNNDLFDEFGNSIDEDDDLLTPTHDENNNLSLEQQNSSSSQNQQQQDDPDELAALFFRSNPDGSSVDNNSDNNNNAARAQRLKKLLARVPNGTMIVDEQQEMKFQQWEKAISFLHQQSRMVMRVSPHPALSLATVVSPTGMNALSEQLSQSAVVSKQLSLLKKGTSNNNNNNNNSLTTSGSYYTRNEVLAFSKTLLMFVAALRDIDSELFGQLHFMSLRNRTLHSAPHTVTAPTISLKQEKIFAEVELIRTFAARAAASLGVASVGSDGSMSMMGNHNDVSSVVTSFSTQNNNTLMSFEAASLPHPSQESLRVTHVEVHVPTVTAAFGPARVRPLAELHITLRERNFVETRQDTLMKNKQQQLSSSSRSRHHHQSPASPSSLLSASTASASRSRSGNIATTDSSLSSNQQQQIIKVCIYANGVLQFPDQNQQSKQNSNAGSLANALGAVEAASRHRSLLSTPHESTLLRGAIGSTSSSSSRSGGKNSKNDASSTSGSSATTASLMLSRMPNRITADNLLLMGATHYNSIHELMVNLLPEAYHTWDELFNGTRLNGMMKTIAEKKMREEEQLKKSRSELKAQTMDSSFVTATTNVASPIPHLRPTSAMSHTSTIASSSSTNDNNNNNNTSSYFSNTFGRPTSANSTRKSQRGAIITPDLHDAPKAMVLADSLPQKRTVLAIAEEDEDDEKYASDGDRGAASSSKHSRNRVFGGFSEGKHAKSTDIRLASSNASSMRQRQQGTSASSSATKTPRPPAERGGGGRRQQQQDADSASIDDSSYRGGGDSATIMSSSYQQGYLPKPIFVSDYPASQLHNSSMMPILLAPRLNGEPILRAITTPIFCDAASALRTHAEFFTRNLAQDNLSPMSEANFAWSLGTRWYVSSPGDTSSSSSSMVNNNNNNNRGDQSPNNNSPDKTGTYMSGTMMTMMQSQTNNNNTQQQSAYSSSYTAASAAIFAMIQNSLLHRPVVRGLSALQETAASSVYSPTNMTSLFNSASRKGSNIAGGSGAMERSMNINNNQGNNSSSINSNQQQQHQNNHNACNVLLAHSLIPAQLLNDPAIWEKIFKFLDPPKYGSEIATPSKILYGLALTRDLTLALDGYLQAIPLDNRPIEDQHDELADGRHMQLFPFIEKNFNRVFQNLVRIACSGQTPHRVFARCVSCLSFYIAVCSSHFSKLSLWPNPNLPNQVSPTGGAATPLHRLLWVGLSFIDVRGLLMASVSRCTSVLNSLIDYSATEDEDAFIVSMTDSSNDEAAQELHASQQRQSYQGVKDASSSGAGGAKVSVSFPGHPSTPTKSSQNHNNSNNNASSPSVGVMSSPTDFLTSGDPTAQDPEYIQSLKLSGAQETAALVVTCGIELIAVSSSCSSEIARRWVHGTSAGGTASPTKKDSNNEEGSGRGNNNNDLNSTTNNAYASSSSSSASTTSAAIFLLDQVFSCTLPELKIAFHFATLAWRAMCLLATPQSTSQPHLTAVVAPSPYAAMTGHTTQEWILPSNVIKSVAANAVAALTGAGGSVLPSPTVSSLLSLIAIIHRVTPAAGRLFSNLRLDKAVGSLWEQLTIRQTQKSSSSSNLGRRLTIMADLASGGLGAASLFASQSQDQQHQDGANNTNGGGSRQSSIFLEEAMKSFSYSLLSAGSSKTKKREILNAAELAGEIAESELFLSLCWVTSVAEDSLSLPAQVAPWIVGMFEGFGTHVGHSFPPVVEKCNLAWTSTNPFSKIFTSSKMTGSMSLFHISMLRSYCRWMEEPSSSFVGGLMRFGAPFTVPSWLNVTEKLLPLVLSHRARSNQQLQGFLNSVAVPRNLMSSTSTTNSSPMFKTTVVSSESYIQFCHQVLMMLADARDSTSEVLIVDCVALDSSFLLQQNDENSLPSASSSVNAHHRLLLSPTDIKDPLPRIEATSNFVFAQFHNALLAAHSGAAAFSQSPTMLNNNSVLNYTASQQQQQQQTPQKNLKSPKTAALQQQAASPSSASKKATPPPFLLSPGFSEVLGLASNFSALVPALDVLLLPHAIKQILMNLASDPNSSNTTNSNGITNDSLANFSFTSPMTDPSSTTTTSSTVKRMSTTMNPNDLMTNRSSTMMSGDQSSSPKLSNKGNSNNNSQYSSECRAPLGKWGLDRLTILAENSAALFPEILFVTPEKLKLSTTFAGCLECITSLRTLARVLQVSMLHFSSDIKAKIIGGSDASSAASATTEWPVPDWTRTLAILMSLLENVMSSHSLAVIRSSRKSAHLIYELELALLNLCSHAAMFISNFGQIVPALSFFLIRYAQPRNLLISDAEGLSGNNNNNGSPNKNSSKFGSNNNSKSSKGNFHQSPSTKLLAGKTAGFASAVGSTAADSELIEISQQHRALRVALMGVLDSILQRATVLIAENSGNNNNNNNNGNNSEQDVLATTMSSSSAASNEVNLSQGLREIVANSVVALAQHTLSPTETRTRSFKFSKLPPSMALAFDFAGPITASALISNDPFVSTEFSTSPLLTRERTVSISSQQKSRSQWSDHDEDDENTSIRVTDTNNNNNLTTAASSPTHNASNLLACVPSDDQLAGKHYDVDRSTAVVFLQRLLVLARKLGIAGVVLQEFARRGISSLILSILDAFHVSQNNNSHNSASGGSTLNNHNDNNMSMMGGGTLRQRQLERRPSTTNIPQLTKVQAKSTLELVSDALLTSIHKCSDEVLHSTTGGMNASSKRNAKR